MNLRFDAKEVNKILGDYYELIGLPIGLYDSSYNHVANMPGGHHNFCQHLREQSPIEESCKICDSKAFEQAKKTKAIYVYKCHLGFYEAVAPIMDHETVIGYIMVGQLRDENTKKFQWESLSHTLDKLGLDKDEFYEYYEKMSPMNHQKLSSAANIMHACAAYLCYKELLHSERSSLFEQIDQYIKANIKESPTIQDICDRFHISKTTLYHLTKQHSGQSYTHYLNSLRVDMAKTLLRNTSGKIKDISARVGIDDYNYFSRVFKQAVGCTPKSYRGK